MKTPEQLRAGHKRSVERHRAILAFLRRHAECIPHWELLSGMAIAEGVFSVHSKTSGSVPTSLLRTWRLRRYWESEQAVEAYASGQRVTAAVDMRAA